MQILGEEAADKVVEDLKFDLQVLNAAMKKLDADWDFTATITPLLSDQGHALAVAAKLKRQIERMTKLRDAFLLQQEQAEKMPAKPAGKMPDKPSGSCQPTRRRRAASREKTQPDELTSTDLEGPPAAPHQALHKRRGPQRARSDGIVVSEALPKWGPSPRFDHAEVRSCHGSRHIRPLLRS